MAINGDANRSLNTWTDLSGLSALKAGANADAKSALPAVARQFESIFTEMMLKSMREASPDDGLMDSEASGAWRDMYDQQLAVHLSQHGPGLGIAQMLVRQLGGKVGGAPESSGTEQAVVGSASDDWQTRLRSVASKVRSAASNAVSAIPADASAFVQALAPYAQEVAHKLGVSVRAVLAQAALETQWGKHLPSDAGGSSNNLFGIKAGSSWGGDRVSVPTIEYEDGIAVRKRAQFRAYDSPADSFADYGRMLSENPRYADALGHGDDVVGFARGLVNGGYATDPSYVHKLAAIANSPQMREALNALKSMGGLPTTSE